ncbi:MAG: DUF4368 domain-containing protein [Lachnospiraceae bacterium]|nr:DUF4368 domain-containing protein [Lachnospiraceae bacterium]
MDTGSLEINEFAAFTNLFNEWYPKSTSKKVKEVKKAKGLAGEHLGAPPYGYLRNPDDNTRWLVDEEAATVVRRIFSLCMQGNRMSAIATILWEDKVLTPSAYKASKGIGVSRVSENPYRLFRKIYEDNVNGKLNDERFYKLSDGYEAEQEQLKLEIEVLTAEVGEADTEVTNVAKLIAVTKKYTRIDELTPEILNAFVDKM